MSRATKTKTIRDTDVQAIRDALATYASTHPSAKIDVQRQNEVCIRIRIIDPDFKKMDLVDRDSMLWDILEPVPDDVASQIVMLLLLTPKEAKTSFANMEFDYPVESD